MNDDVIHEYCENCKAEFAEGATCYEWGMNTYCKDCLREEFDKYLLPEYYEDFTEEYVEEHQDELFEEFAKSCETFAVDG